MKNPTGDSSEPSRSRLSPLTLESANALLSPLGSHPEMTMAQNVRVWEFSRGEVSFRFAFDEKCRKAVELGELTVK